MAKKRKQRFIKHLWSVKVRHQDNELTELKKVLMMMETTLFVVTPERDGRSPHAERAIERARAFMNRHRRQFQITSIRGVEYYGTIDE